VRVNWLGKIEEICMEEQTVFTGMFLHEQQAENREEETWSYGERRRVNSEHFWHFWSLSKY
jgi:hypothetical protein